MTEYYGDFLEDASVYIPFNTFSSDDPSASVTITNLVAGDIKVHKDGSTTEIVTDGATIAIDFDSITGNHLITVDTSASADYSTGSDYLVRIEGTTVDGATINAWVGTFSIENRTGSAALRPTTAGRTLDVTATGAAGVDWGNVENASTSVDLSATSINLCDTITTYTGNTVQTGDSYARIGANGAGLSSIPWNASWDAEVQSECTDALNAYDPPTNAEMEARTLVAADYFDPAADTVANVTTVATTTNLTNQAGVIASGTAQSATSTTLVLASGETFADNELVGATAVITGGSTGVGQSRVITGNVGSTDTITVDTWTTTPTGTITYDIHATAPSSSTSLPDVNVTQVGGVAEDLPTATALATVDTVVDGIQADLDNGTDGLGALKTLIDALQVEVEKLTTTAHTEPTGVPAANEAPIDKLGYLFMALRNQVDVTATKKTFYDDGGTAEWEKDLSDDGTTYSESEGNAI